MGRDYPAYTPEGGVACYVVEARARDDWIPGYYVPKILYWLDRETFFPLRIEEYDASGVLTYVEERTAQLVNPESGKRGYENHFFLAWDIPQDLLNYEIHDAYRPQLVSRGSRGVLQPRFSSAGLVCDAVEKPGNGAQPGYVLPPASGVPGEISAGAADCALPPARGAHRGPGKSGTVSI